ncbi:unnamed protein product [Closterium sp. Naga37s-1]|nr:unnamed protein product [Closterium sp. Naga37s-1]
MGSYVHPNNSWLPPDVAAQAASEEPGRFHAVAEEVQAAWKRGKEQGHGGETLKWVSVVNSFVASKSRLEVADLELVSETALDIITCCRGPRDLFIQIRWSQCMSRILRKHRYSLSLSIPWRPLYSILAIHLPSAPGSTTLPGYVGAALLQIHINAITELIRRARRFFPPGSAADIWAFLRPQFADVSSNDALEAAALLNLLLPTTCRHVAPHEEDVSAEWSVWVPEWLSLWSSIPHCTFWDAQWISLLARLAKHQQLRHQHQTTSSSTSSPASLLSLWTPHLPFLFQKILESFSLPIGQSPSATSAQLERPVSPACARVFLSLLDRWQQRRVPHQQQVVRAVAGAKLVVWLLANPEPAARGSDAEPPVSGSDRALEVQGGAVSVLRLFDKLSNDLEQFFHPSNGGEWTGLLEKMIHSATYHLMKRIAAEKKIHGDRYPSSGAPSALSPATTTAFIRLLTRLIHNRALFSKSPTLSAVASRVAASLSYLAPRVTLPVVLESFQGALTTVTATHQLESALSTLALSVRPLLLAAAQTPSHQDVTLDSMDVDGSDAVGGAGEGGGMGMWQEIIGRAREVVSEALVATLPGIDANDPPKTLATLHLYLSVFSSIGPIGDEESPFALSIDWSTWLEDFLSRLFSLFSHLESAAPTVTVASAAAGTERSFLMKEAEGSTFRSTVSILFARLSPPLLNQIISRVERYVSSSVVRGCEEEIGTVVAALAYAAPEATCNRILAGVMDSAISLLQSLPATSFLGLAESPAAAADAGEVLKLPANQLSTTQEATVLFHMHLASNAVPFSGSALIAHKERLIALIDAAFSSTSQKVVDAAADLLQKFLFALIFYYPLNEYTFLGWEQSAPGVERWFSKQAAAAEAAAASPMAAGQVAAAGALQWHVPSTEETTLATQLIGKYLGGALRDIRWLRSRPATSASASSAAVGAKLAWRVALRRLWAVFSGTRTNLPDLTTRFGSQASGAPTDATALGTPLAVVGRSGVTIGDVTMREEASGELHEACVWLVRRQRDDTQTLTLLAEVEGLLLNPGTLEYSDSLHGLRVVKQQAGLLSEPKGSPWMQAGETRRRPPWVLAELAYEHLLWRASQAHFKTIYAGQRRPPPLPRAVKVLLGDLLLLSVHRYESVQGVARASLELLLKRFPPAVGVALAQLAPCVAGEAGAVARLIRMGKSGDSNGGDSSSGDIEKGNKEKSATGKEEEKMENAEEGEEVEEKEDREEAAVGACQVFVSRPIMRKTAYDWRALAPFLSALLASHSIDSLKALNAINQLFIAFVSRFAGVNPIRPHRVPATGEEQAGAEESGWESGWESSGGDGASGRGRGRGGGGRLAGLFGGGGNGAGGGDNPGATVSALFSAGLAASAMSALLSDWPRSKSRGLVPSCPQSSSFVVANAMLFELLVQAAAAPGDAIAGAAAGTAASTTAVTAFLHALYPFLQDLVAKETDRGAQSTSAEIIAGLLASAHPSVLHACCAEPEPEARTEDEPQVRAGAEAEVPLGSAPASLNPPASGWLASLFHQAILHCSVESQTDWATCVRYVLTRRGQDVSSREFGAGELDGGGDGRGGVRGRIQRLVREKLLEKLPGNAASGQQAKRLMLLVVAVGETGQGGGRAAESKEQGEEEEEELRFLVRLADEAKGLMTHGARQVRQLLGEVLSALLAALSARFAASSSSSSSASSSVAASLSNHILAEAAKAATVIKSMGSSTEQHKETKEGSTKQEGEMEGVERKEGGDEGSSGAGKEGSEEDRSVWTMESILYFLMSAVKSGDAPPFLPTIVALLPSLLSIQEPPNTDLSLLAKQCLAYTKYLPLSATAVPAAAAAVLAAAQSGNWKERAAALSFCQSFVFRNGFLLSTSDLSSLREAVITCLQDPQPEVRDMASATLAGLFKAAPQGDTWPAAIRQGFVQSAASTLKASRAARRRAIGGKSLDAESAAKAAARMVKMHGSALGLAAAVRSAPYDVPLWLPDVLLSLASLAQEPAPVGPAVGKALGDFKRTHADSWHIHKEAFSSEQLEVINDLSSTVGYFV